MFCIYCGNKLDDDSVFCPKCGKKVSSDEEKKAEQPKAETTPVIAKESPNEPAEEAKPVEVQEQVKAEEPKEEAKTAMPEESAKVEEEAPAYETTATFCIHCGNKLDEDSAFCPKCGNRLDEARVQIQPKSVKASVSEKQPISETSNDEKPRRSKILFVLLIAEIIFTPFFAWYADENSGDTEFAAIISLCLFTATFLGYGFSSKIYKLFMKTRIHI